ncbi:hypoxia-inducible factor 1-alpha-like isoform X2 [Hemiscyllium ocellatum]|nr:hypoxia-inducible factor 1-alpha-like isoform X2 [Hemiscyllium ocellatum]
MVLTAEGDIVYLSENVSQYLGLSQLDLIGHSVFDFVHPCDEEELKDLVTPHHAPLLKQEVQTERDFFLRMKSTLTSRGRTVAVKSASWKVLHCTGHMKRCVFPDSGFPDSPKTFLVMICEPIPHPSNIEISLDNKTFLSQHSLDMKFTYCDQKITDLIGYQPKAMLGHTSYEFYHSLDANHMTKTHRILLSKGQVISPQYRFLARSGGYVWLRTQASTISSSKSNQPQSIICINSVLSNVMEESVTFSLGQTRLLTPDADPENGQRLLSQWEENPKKSDELGPAPGDSVVSLDLAGQRDTKAFHFTRRLPDDGQAPLSPEDFCSPALCKLLSPIFNGLEMSSSTDSKPLSKQPERTTEDPDTPGVTLPKPGSSQTAGVNIEESEKNLLTADTKALQAKTTQEAMELDLEMLAPYISMEEDFQLNSLECAEDKDGQACADIHPEPRGRSARATESRSFSGSLTEPRNPGPASSRPRSCSFHGVRPSVQDHPQREGDSAHPEGNSAALQRSCSVTNLSMAPGPGPDPAPGQAPASGYCTLAFGGPAFTVAVKNVLLALFQPQTTEAKVQTPSSKGQEATSAGAAQGLEPSDLLDTAGLSGESAQHALSKQRSQRDSEFRRNLGQLSPQILDLRNLKRKHSLLVGNLQDSNLDVSSVADIVQVTAKRLKSLETQQAETQTETVPSGTPMTLTMQLLGKEVPAPPELTRYDCEVNAPLPEETVSCRARTY